MAMTKAQQEYSISRITDLHKTKVRDILERHSTPAKTLTNKEKWDLVTSGKVKPTYKGTPSPYADWIYIFDFSKYEAKEALSAAGQKLLDEEDQRFQAAKDEIMLGDAQEAMSIVSNY